MDTAGKAVALLGTDRAGLALGGDAGAEPRLPLDVPGHHRRGPLRAGRDADAAARGARQARPQGRPPVASLGPQRRASLAALRPLGRAALAPAVPCSVASPSWRCWSWPYRCSRCAPAMPSIKVVPPGDQSRQGYEQIQAGFGPGAPGALQIVAPDSARQRGGDRGAGGSGHRPVPAAPAGWRRPGADRGDPDRRSLEPRAGRDDRSPALRASLRRVGRRRGGREPRPRGRAGGQDARGHRGRPGARLPAAAPRVPGARGGRDRRGQPTCSRPAPPSGSPSGSSRTATSRDCSASSRRASSMPGRRCSSSR